MNDLVSTIGVVAPLMASAIGYIVSRDKRFRTEIKELNDNHRKDIKDLMFNSRKERQEQRESLERISLESNKVMTKLTMTVAELKVMVDSKMR
tara:strand:+ start:43 stop:321 length:279 start_codon:yes stop_codon:yes gene_type:complete